MPPIPASLAFAALSLAAGLACAQSSVTVFGTADVNLRYVKTDGQPRRFSENPSGLNSGQFGIRGEEDLGGGIKAGFMLISELLADTGNAGVNGRFWNRQSIVRLSSPWGEVRLGRDYKSSYLNQFVFDVFGNVGVANVLNIHQLYDGSRIDNTVAYLLPTNLGGFYGELRAAASEGGTTLDRPGRYLGARFGYAKGPLNLAAAFGQQRFAIGIVGITAAPFTGTPALSNGALVPVAAGSTQKSWNLAGSYDFGPVKLIGFYDREDLAGRRENLYHVGGVVPVGLGEIRVGYARSKMTPAAPAVLAASSTTLDQIGLQYVHNLSKRTALYGTASRLSNKQATTVTLPGSAGAARPGGKSQGVEFGIRHFF